MNSYLTLTLKPECATLFREEEYSNVIGLIRVVLNANDERVRMVRAMEDERLGRGAPGVVVASWVERVYEDRELATAEVFHMIPTQRFEPTGEQCGTEYDLSSSCPSCWAGRKRTSPLRLDIRTLPKKGGLASSIGGELVVGHELAKILDGAGFRGFQVSPVLREGERERTLEDFLQVDPGRRLIDESQAQGVAPMSNRFYMWLSEPDRAPRFQRFCEMEGGLAKGRIGPSGPGMWFALRIDACATLSNRTVAGIDVFRPDGDGKGRCERGDTIGFRLISEAYFSGNSVHDADLFVSDRYVGWHAPGNLLYPTPVIGCSRRFRDTFIETNARGLRFEVAHLV